MRIIAGNLRGSTLYVTKDKTTRPLKDLVRESIFNLLTHSNKILFQLDHSNILDLYSGTGSFGLECLSRNAKNVYFVENEKNAFQILKKNIKKLKLEKTTKVFFSEVFHLMEKKNYFPSKFDLVFCDPPFKDMSVEKLIKLIFKKNLLNKNGIIILHRNVATKEKFPDRFKILEERVYGVSKIIFGKFLP
jgi:16S rRNA (guanine966-N2)-methyltransferase